MIWWDYTRFYSLGKTSDWISAGDFFHCRECAEDNLLDVLAWSLCLWCLDGGPGFGPLSQVLPQEAGMPNYSTTIERGLIFQSLLYLMVKKMFQTLRDAIYHEQNLSLGAKCGSHQTADHLLLQQVNAPCVQIRHTSPTLWFVFFSRLHVDHLSPLNRSRSFLFSSVMILLFSFLPLSPFD